MVQHTPHVPSPAPYRTTQIGPKRWLVVDRFGCIGVECVNAQGYKTYLAPEGDDLAAARQLTWWRSPANPLAPVQGVKRADGCIIRGAATYSTDGRYWIMVEVVLPNRKTIHPPAAIPRTADAAAYVRALLTVEVPVSSPSKAQATPFLA